MYFALILFSVIISNRCYTNAYAVFFLVLTDFYPPVEQIVEQCGKFSLLDRLLKHLFARKHKVCLPIIFGFVFVCYWVANILNLYSGSYLLSVDKDFGYYGLLF